MRLSIFSKGEVVHNGLDLEDGEVVEYSVTTLQTGLDLKVDPLGVRFTKFGEVVVGAPSDLTREDVETMTLGVLMKIKRYPAWIEEMERRLNIDGRHTIILVSGSDRYGYRRELTNYARLVLNTGGEDLYVCKGRFNLDLEGNVYLSEGEDPLENLRRVFMMTRHTEGPIRYSELPNAVFLNPGKIRGIFSMGGWTVETALEALKIMEEELVDVRIPREACWAQSGIGEG